MKAQDLVNKLIEGYTPGEMGQLAAREDDKKVVPTESYTPAELAAQIKDKALKLYSGDFYAAPKEIYKQIEDLADQIIYNETTQE